MKMDKLDWGKVVSVDCVQTMWVKGMSSTALWTMKIEYQHMQKHRTLQEEL
jgi:hypothetical protein